MNAFTIDTDSNITVYDSKTAAYAAALAEESRCFTRQDELAEILKDAPRAALVEIYNSFTGITEVRKFTSRLVGITRIFRECQKMANEIPNTIAEPAAIAAQTPVKAPKEPKAQKAAKSACNPKTTAESGESKAPREGSKTAKVIEMLQRDNGATLEEIMSTFGWLQHTTRALVSAGGQITKKHGFTVVSEKVGEERRYRIAS